MDPTLYEYDHADLVPNEASMPDVTSPEPAGSNESGPSE
jgi:hypothetical protein